jgi:hypothetical protein
VLVLGGVRVVAQASAACQRWASKPEVTPLLVLLAWPRDALAIIDAPKSAEPRNYKLKS